MTSTTDHKHVFHDEASGFTATRLANGDVLLEFRSYRTAHGQYEVREAMTLAADKFPELVAEVGYDFGDEMKRATIALAQRIHNGPRGDVKEKS